jgi:5-methyltetrahydropteroyltriglutamate--homocysteine methyltransferase
MSQQAQNDYYGHRRRRRRWIMPLRSTPRSATCSPRAPTWCSSTSRTCRRDPEAAREYGLEALNRALEGVDGRTCVHICFGYAALIHARPEGYSYLPELAGACCDQVSIETAQSNLDCSVLDHLPDKDILLGVLDLSTPEVEDVETIKQRVRRALDHVNQGVSFSPRTAV